MKDSLFKLSFSVLVFALSAFTTHKIIASQKTQVEIEETNPTITIYLPDQEYVISKRDLESLGSELTVPKLDNAVSKVIYNQALGVVESLSSPKDYVIDVSTITSSTPTYILQDRNQAPISAYNSALNKIYRSPLEISLKDGSINTSLSLDPPMLRSLITPSSVALNTPPDINKKELISYVQTRLTPKQKNYFDAESLYQNTRKAINLRFMGEGTPVVLGVDDGPSSRGELADKYLEVDLSQQKMYFFINRQLFKEYKVSTGAEYPTPVGEYHILNKAPLAFSDIYNVWMPYWMGFTYARDVGAYLGLHEIAYAKDTKGKPIYKHGYYIGDMMTGGCIAMEPKDSREIYNLSGVGMLVRIVK